MRKISFIIVTLLFVSSCATQQKDKRPELIGEWALDISNGPQFGAKKHNQATPLVIGDDVFQGSVDNKLVVVNKFNGLMKRRIKDSGGIDAAPLFHESVVYFGNMEGYIKAFSYRTGEYLWSYYTGYPVYSTPTYCDDRVFVLSSSNIFYSLDAKTGKVLWTIRKEFPMGVPVVKGASSAVCYDDVVYVGFSDGSFVGANIVSGSVVMDKKLFSTGKFKDVDATPYVDDKIVIVPSYDGNLYCINRSSGQIIWSIKDGSSRSVSAIGEDIYYSSNDGYLYLLDSKDGSVRWRTKLSQGMPTAPAIINNYVVVGSSERGIMLFRKDDGRFVGEFNSGTGVLADPVVDGNYIYFMSNFGVLYSVRVI
jgi:outer membrane protein assembly factor BamB